MRKVTAACHALPLFSFALRLLPGSSSSPRCLLLRALRVLCGQYSTAIVLDIAFQRRVYCRSYFRSAGLQRVRKGTRCSFFRFPLRALVRAVATLSSDCGGPP